MKRHGFARPRCRPRRAAQAPLARFDRRLCDPGPGVQGHPDGRSSRRRAHHDAEPEGPLGRRRAGRAADQGRDPRPDRRRSCSSAPPPRSRPCGRCCADGHRQRAVAVRRRRGHRRAARRRCSTSRSTSRWCTRWSSRSLPPPARARTTPRTAARSAVVGASRTARRAPAAPVRVRPARRSSSAVASSTARRRARYAQRTPKKMKAAALRSALSDRARGGKLHVVSGLVEGDTPSTKSAAAALANDRVEPARAGRRRAHRHR